MFDFEVGLVCLNGHCASISVNPNTIEKYCSSCGQPLIHTCQFCKAPIKGNEIAFGMIGQTDIVPYYCYNCGKPYPWMEAALEATAMLVREEDSLSDLQKQDLIDSLPDIITEGPKTNIAIVRMKKALIMVGKFTADGLRQFAIDFGSQVAVKSLGL